MRFSVFFVLLFGALTLKAQEAVKENPTPINITRENVSLGLFGTAIATLWLEGRSKDKDYRLLAQSNSEKFVSISKEHAALSERVIAALEKLTSAVERSEK